MKIYESFQNLKNPHIQLVRVRTENGEYALDPRLDLRNHSPDGFAWGYLGSGPSQLALAILCDHFQDDVRAAQLYQDFKYHVISKIPIDDHFQFTEDFVECVVIVLECARRAQVRAYDFSHCYQKLEAQLNGDD